MKKELVIHPTATVKEAMEALDLTAEKVLLVVDEKMKLLGTLTDGDIRRFILKENNLKGEIVTAYNVHPVFIYEENLSDNNIKNLLVLNKVNLVPIVDTNFILVDYITADNIFKDNSLINGKEKLDAPVVIMAGGKGTRLDFFTMILPKPLIPIKEKPIINHIIDHFREYEMNEFYITVNYKAQILKAYFKEYESAYKLSLITEKKPLGTAGSLRYLKNKFNCPFFLTNCDIIINANYFDIYEFHKKNNYDITLVASVKHFKLPYGTCILNGNGHLDYINEKPESSYLVNTGMYVINPGIIESIPEDTHFHMTHLIEKIKKENKHIGVYPISEQAWIDVGQWAEYKNAIESFNP